MSHVFCQIRGTWLVRLKQRKPCPMMTKSDCRSYCNHVYTRCCSALFNKLDTSEVGTSKLLIVSRTHLHTLVPSSNVKNLLARISGLLWRGVLVQEKGESMLGVFMRLDFCEHNVSGKDCVSGGDAVVVFTGSVAETVLCSFVKRRSRWSCTGLFWKPLSRVSCELLCVGAGPSVYAATWRNFVHYVLLERVSVREVLIKNVPW